MSFLQKSPYLSITIHFTGPIISVSCVPLGYAIHLYNDNVLGALHQQAFNPNVETANVSIHNRVMILAISIHFGGNLCTTG